MEKEKKCKTCKRDGIPSDETECGRCEKIRQLYQIRKELVNIVLKVKGDLLVIIVQVRIILSP